ncbi:MAG: WD40 repeat domain-containing protein [Opitutales bacterium]
MKFLAAIFATVVCLQGAPITALHFSPDGNHLLVSQRRAIEARPVEGKGKPRMLTCPFDKISAFAFSRDGRVLAVAGGTPGEEGGVQLLDWPSGKVRGEWNEFFDTATDVAFAENGQLAASSADHSIALLEVSKKPRLVKLLEGHTKAVRGLAYAPGGKTLVSVSADRTMKSWTVSTGKLERSFGNHFGPVHAVVFRLSRKQFSLPKLTSCATASDDRTVRIWQPAIGRMVRIVRGHGGPIFAVAFSPDGKRLYSIGQEGIGRIIDADSDQVLHQWKAHDDWTYALAVSSNGKLATGDWKGEVKFWTIKDDKALPLDH